MEGFVPLLTFLAAIGCGVVAGVFFAFSAFVMSALDRLPAAQAIGAMQAINASAPKPAFMAVLFGTALACGAVILCSVFVWGEPLAVYLLAGGALYLVCAIGSTAVYHVPRNEALAKVEPCGADAEDRWSRYFAGWTAWNHLRFAGALAAAGALAIALHIG
jgi:uncharacterized membrane protein